MTRSLTAKVLVPYFMVHVPAMLILVLPLEMVGHTVREAAIVLTISHKAYPPVIAALIIFIAGLIVCLGVQILWYGDGEPHMAGHMQWILAWLGILLECAAEKLDYTLAEVSASRTFRSIVELGSVL